MTYRAEVDGLRAIAVTLVILFHSGVEQFAGGFIGVDVFFVISGYLITTIVINDLENQKFSLGDFYERRIRRILPLLLVVIAVSYLMSWWLFCRKHTKTLVNLQCLPFFPHPTFFCI